MNRGNSAFISGEQGNKGQILRRTKTILGNREHKKTNFQFLGNIYSVFPHFLYFRSPWDSHLLFLRVLGQISRVPCENAYYIYGEW